MSQLHVRILERAADILGGTEELASFLGVSPLRLRIWMHGIAGLPDDIFLRVVDLISAITPQAHPDEPSDGEKNAPR